MSSAPQSLNNPWAAPAAIPATPAPVAAPTGLNNPWAASAAPVAPEKPALNNPWAAPAKPALNNPWAATPQPQQPDDSHWWSRSIIQDVAGSDLLEAGRQKLSSALKSVPPAKMQGQYMTDFADEFSKAGPQIANFALSPMGLGLLAVHAFPATAPYAGAVDMLLGGQQALQAIPDMASAVSDIHDPRKMARAMVEVLGAYAGLKGGAKVGEAMRSIPPETGAGLSLPEKAGAMVKAYGEAHHKTAPPPPPPGVRGADLRAALDAADPEDRPGIIQQAEQPQSLVEKTQQALYRTPYVRGVVNTLVPRAQQPAVLELGQNLVNEYVSNIEVERNRVRRVVDDIQRNVPEEDRTIRRMGYAMEGDQPEGGPLSPQGTAALEKIRELTRSRDAMLREAKEYEVSLLDPETYIRHYWDFDAPGGDSARRQIAVRSMRDPSLQARTIGSLKHGIEVEGLTPKYNDVTDVIMRRHMEAVRSIENQKFANTLRDYGLLVDPTKANVRGLPWNDASSSPVLKRAVYAGTNDAGDAVMREQAPRVHPDIEMAVNTIFNEPFKGVGWNVINQLRAFSKQIAAGYSMFHNGIISEVSQANAAAAGGLDAIRRVAKAIAWPLDPEFRKGVVASLWDIRGRHGAAPDAPVDIRLSNDTIHPWLKAGMSFQSGESESAAIQAARDFMANRGPLLKTLGSPIRALGDIQYLFNNSLFNYYLPGQMLHSAEHLYASEANRLGPNPTPEAEFASRQAIADHVSRTYGAENWQRLLMTPKAQQALGMVFFAPMWMLSRLRTLTKGYETTAGASLTNRYLAGAALTYFLTSQLSNYAASSWYGDPKRYPDGGGEYWDDETQQWKRGGHWTWQNPGDPVKIAGRYMPGINSHSGDIYFGKNPDGSARYIRQGKFATDAFLMLSHPLESIGSKLSLPLREAMTAITGSEPGSGYQVVNPKLTEDQQNEQRLASLATAVTPFSAESLVQQLEHHLSPEVFREPGAVSQIYGLPARRGASFSSSVQDLRSALDANRQDLAEQILRNAQLNGIDPRGIIKEVGKRMRSGAITAAGIPVTTQPPEPPQQ